jgi:hypothetical protein
LRQFWLVKMFFECVRKPDRLAVAQFYLGPAAVQPGMAEMVPEPVRVYRDPGLPPRRAMTWQMPPAVSGPGCTGGTKGSRRLQGV